jgi:hypothetical protein
LTPLQLTPLGLVHTGLSLATIVLVIAALAVDGEITASTLLGRAYIAGLVVTTVTGFPIMRHGSIGPPHILGVITLAVVALALLAGRGIFGRGSRAIEAVSYSATVLLLMIPGVTETLTRLPLGAPVAAAPDAPVLQAIDAALFVLFLIAAVRQVRALRAQAP